MHTIVVGLNYRTAPVEIREKFAIADGQLAEALRRLKTTKSILECVIVATCNRTEIYAVVDRLNICGHDIRCFMEEWFEIPRREFAKYLYIYEDRECLKHLMRVASGLDSMVIGETQILGQVRDAFFEAQRLGTTSTIFNHLFQQTITFAKRAHTQTSISESAVSVSYAAVELGKQIFGSFQGKTVMIVGAGKMGELTGKHLMSYGVERIIVANRTMERAAQLADRFGAEACLLADIPSRIPETDVLISSTGAQDWLLTKEQLATVMPKREDRPLFMIDISVPRNLDPAIGELPNVYLYDIDDLEGIVEENLEHRRQEAEKIEAMIEQEISAHEYWFKTLHVGPVIRALQDKARTIHEDTLISLYNKLPDLDGHARKVIDKLTRSIVTQLLQDPIARIKEMAADSNGDEMVDAFVKIFALESALPYGPVKVVEHSKRNDDEGKVLAKELKAAQDERSGHQEQQAQRDALQESYPMKELVAGS